MGCGGSEEVEIEAIYIDEEELVENPPPVFKSKEQEAIDASPLLAFTIKFEGGECKKEVRSMARVRGLKRELVKRELSKVHADCAVQLLLVWTDPSDEQQVVELENDNRWSELEAIGIKAVRRTLLLDDFIAHGCPSAQTQQSAHPHWRGRRSHTAQ